MPYAGWFGVLDVSRKDFLPAFLLLFNAFTWVYMTFLMIDKFQKVFNLPTSEAIIIQLIFSLSVIGSSIISSISFHKQRLQFLYAWMILGAASSLLPLLLVAIPYVWSFALGFSLGVGMPVCLTYFADSSTVENRGSRGGLIFLAIYLVAALATIVFTLFDLTVGFVLLSVWRAAGLVLLILLKPQEIVDTEKKKKVNFSEVLKDKSFLLYLIPWIMFWLIDRFERPVFGNYLGNPLISSALMMGPIISSFSAFAGGLLADRIGRKKVIIGGFVALGLAYAVIGIAPDALISWYFYTIADGIAWGILLATFLFTLWGDLSQFGGREKYYVIGGTPFYFISVMELLLGSYAVQIPAYAAFSLASFFLFIAVLPLLYAPETLPQKHIELRQLRGYIEQARKIKEKAPA
jgi:MFS family permease